jgi:NADH dehydrogenase FAD-containing subunit/rhodanese-related sulfurtransferase
MQKRGKKTIVFGGGGHAHLYSLRRTHELTAQRFEVVLVNPSRFLYYSGMAPGMLSRIYRPEEGRIDIKYLVEKGGGRFVKDYLTEIHPDSGEISLAGGRTIPYDVMSLCLGSGVPNQDFAASIDHLTPVKPVENMENLYWKLRGFEEWNGRPRVLIVGGGPGGCEMACNCRKVFEDHGIEGQITIVDANPELLKSAPGKARRIMREFMQRRGIEVLTGTRVVKVEDGVAHTQDGQRLRFDLLILAVGIKPPDIFRKSGLKVAYDDGLWINEHLQSVTDPRIFGGGDSVAFRGEPLTRLGVFAIRQGPVIFHNLQAFLRGEPLKKFRPQPVFLYILNLGNYEGLAIWGPLVWSGKRAWDLKHYIDTRFMRRFQYPEDRPGEVAEYFERLSEEDVCDVGVNIESPGALRAATGGTPCSATDDVSSLAREKAAGGVPLGYRKRARRGGHIPSSTWLNWKRSLRRDNTMKPAAELREMFDRAGFDPNGELIVYCQSAACSGHQLFALKLLGHDNVKNYDGSWKEWGNSELPIQTRPDRLTTVADAARPYAAGVLGLAVLWMAARRLRRG